MNTNSTDLLEMQAIEAHVECRASAVGRRRRRGRRQHSGRREVKGPLEEDHALRPSSDYSHKYASKLQNCVGVLVNCLSARSSRPELFASVPRRDSASAAILNCNVAAATHLTRLALEGMCARRRGLVLLVCSTAALLPSPMLSVYGASQAYVDKFARDLALECASLGVIVESHTPGLIADGPSGCAAGGLPGGRSDSNVEGRRSLRAATWSVPTPRRYAEASLASLGSSATTPAYAPHCLLVALARWSLWAAPGPTARAYLRGMEALRVQAMPR